MVKVHKHKMNEELKHILQFTFDTEDNLDYSLALIIVEKYITNENFLTLYKSLLAREHPSIIYSLILELLNVK